MRTKLISALAAVLAITSCGSRTVVVSVDCPGSSRAEYGAGKIADALSDNPHYTVLQEGPADVTIHVDCVPDPDFKEGFRIRAGHDGIFIEGADESGMLYACMELCDRLEEKGRLPRALNIADRPDMVLRGTCIGLQKTSYLPGHKVYEYPYTEENFPWFYDKEMWVKYLDMMVENRMNSLYLWNGHPFASLVRLQDYPYAVEVSEDDFRKNVEMFSFITSEADKRGIWVIQMFYNIIVSKPFADHHGIPTQNRNVEITPLLSDYTRKSIAAFIENYPNVGLLVCLGEAMNTVEDDVEWFTRTIIPGVKDGLGALGKTEEPPIVLRAHDTDCRKVMDAALPVYGNLYTMNKYNGESLCIYEPRGPWAETHRSLSSLGSVHIENVHILANLEPFRYGSPEFIRKSIAAMHDVHGANGLHLYPQASYWDWPYSADKLENGERLLEMDRDWIWYRAWGRYAWDRDADIAGGATYWSRLLSDRYGCSAADAKKILEAYDQSGEISPKLTRKFAITEGNRQTFLLGMYLGQLVNPEKYKVYPDFANSCGPEGEKLELWADREWKGLEHTGETPPKLVSEVREHARLAVKAIDGVRSVRKDEDEFLRLKNDIHCYEAFASFFTDKVEAAMAVLMYRHNGDPAELDKACSLLQSSLEHYRRLVGLADSHYLYANSMQTSQRKIPTTGRDGQNKLWSELLPAFEKEASDFASDREAFVESLF